MPWHCSCKFKQTQHRLLLLVATDFQMITPQSPSGGPHMVPVTNSPKRVAVSWPVMMKTRDGSKKGSLRNINEKGTFILCNSPTPLHATIDLIIEPPEHPPLRLTGQVVWTNQHGPDDEITPRGMGVRFTGIPEEDYKFLRSVVLSGKKTQQTSTLKPE